MLTVSNTDNLYLIAWTMDQSINWNQAMTMGAFTVVVFWLAHKPTRWLYLHIKDKQNMTPSMGQLLLVGVSTVVCIIGCTLALALLGVMSGYGLKVVGVQQAVIQQGTITGFTPLVKTTEPRKIYRP